MSGTYTNITRLLTKRFSTDDCEFLSKKSAHLLQEELQRLSTSIVSLEHRYMAVSNEGDHQNSSKIGDTAKQGVQQESFWVKETTERIWNAEQAKNLSEKIDALKKVSFILIYYSTLILLRNRYQLQSKTKYYLQWFS